METDLVSETLCYFVLFRFPDDGQRPKPSNPLSLITFRSFIFAQAFPWVTVLGAPESSGLFGALRCLYKYPCADFPIYCWRAPARALKRTYAYTRKFTHPIYLSPETGGSM
jgi:hypothetical protein